jgi:hypothetical protein
MLSYTLKPGQSNTFKEYASIFHSYIEAQLTSVIRLDIIWDVYLQNSVKNEARVQRGSGFRYKVAGSSKLPKVWSQFLHVSENKEDLIKYLAESLSQLLVEAKKEIFYTQGQNVFIRSGSPELRTEEPDLQPCNRNHEEADIQEYCFYHYFMHLQGVIQHQHFMAGGKSMHGIRTWQRNDIKLKLLILF